jgi:hypothetical protein
MLRLGSQQPIRFQVSSRARSSVVNGSLRGAKEQRSFKPQAAGSIPAGRTLEGLICRDFEGWGWDKDAPPEVWVPLLGTKRRAQTTYRGHAGGLWCASSPLRRGAVRPRLWSATDVPGRYETPGQPWRKRHGRHPRPPYHEFGYSWSFESPDIPGLTGGGDSYDRVHTEAAPRFALTRAAEDQGRPVGAHVVDQWAPPRGCRAPGRSTRRLSSAKRYGAGNLLSARAIRSAAANRLGPTFWRGMTLDCVCRKAQARTHGSPVQAQAVRTLNHASHALGVAAAPGAAR